MPTNPPPPSQRQAAEAQRSRHAAELAILSLFIASEAGDGGGEDDSSILHSIKIASILTALSASIVLTSFRSPRDRAKSLLAEKPDHEQVSQSILTDAQSLFNELAGSDLTDEQKSVLWATWAHSRASEEIAEAVNSGRIEHEFSKQGSKLRKVWISRTDARVRPLHAKLHGRTVPTSSDFWRWPDTGQRLRWPGDRKAPPEATIGCRCVVLLTWATQEGVSETIRKIVDDTKNG